MAWGTAALGSEPVRFGAVVRISGDQLAALCGAPINQLELLACAQARCHPIPFQIDERDAQGQWVLDRGPNAGADDPPGVLDDNDILFFTAAAAGDRVTPESLPTAASVAEIRVHDPLAQTDRWAYFVALTGTPLPPLPAQAFPVEYDPVTDRVRGARVSLGFVDGIPGYLAVGDGPNLLDRLKVRASATLLFGLIRFSRSEADLRTQFMGWHQGPIRVVRGQRQWIRLGWGIRSPTFGSYTYFYPDSAELPVGLWLNFRPTYFFGNIVVQAVLDFRDLRGWSVLVPSLPNMIPIDGTMSLLKQSVNNVPDTWFALIGPEITLVQRMDVSPSLATVRRRLVYREGGAVAQPPDTVPGEVPGIGYQLDRWQQVGAGAHVLQAASYALPASVDVRAFMHELSVPLEVTVRPLTPSVR